MSGFRSLGDAEEVEFECKMSEKGLEATRVTGPSFEDCQGSNFRPTTKRRYRKMRCYNCGEFANHIAAKCQLGPQPKRCHHCKSEDHLIADCPDKSTTASKKSSSSWYPSSACCLCSLSVSLLTHGFLSRQGWRGKTIFVLKACVLKMCAKFLQIFHSPRGFSLILNLFYKFPFVLIY